MKSNQNKPTRYGLSAIEVAKQQIGKIIDFASAKSNIIKDLQTALLRFRKSMDDAKQNHVRLVKTAAAAEPADVKVAKPIQAFALGKAVADATACDKHSQKRVRQLSGEELSGGARKARKILTPKVGIKAGKSNPSQASRKAGKAGPSLMEGNRGLRP